MRYTKQRFRRAWTPEEDATLRRLYESGASLNEIGALLNRASSSVETRARSLKLQRHSGAPRTVAPTWPDMLFEDDPRACRREPLWRGEPVAKRSLMGCAAAMAADAI